MGNETGVVSGKTMLGAIALGGVLGLIIAVPASIAGAVLIVIFTSGSFWVSWWIVFALLEGGAWFLVTSSLLDDVRNPRPPAGGYVGTLAQPGTPEWDLHMIRVRLDEEHRAPAAPRLRQSHTLGHAGSPCGLPRGR